MDHMTSILITCYLYVLEKHLYAHVNHMWINEIESWSHESCLKLHVWNQQEQTLKPCKPLTWAEDHSDESQLTDSRATSAPCSASAPWLQQQWQNCKRNQHQNQHSPLPPTGQTSSGIAYLFSEMQLGRQTYLSPTFLVPNFVPQEDK